MWKHIWQRVKKGRGLDKVRIHPADSAQPGGGEQFRASPRLFTPSQSRSESSVGAAAGVGREARLCCLRWARLSIASESCCFTSERPPERDRPSWEGGEPGWGTIKRPQVNRAAYRCAQVPSSCFTLGSKDSCRSAGRSFTLLFLCIDSAFVHT